MEESTERMENGALLRHRLKTLEVHVEKIDAKIDRLGEILGKVASVVHCPRPGYCMDLDVVVKGHEQELRRINAAISWAKGAAWAAGFLGGAMGALGSLVIQHFTRLG